MKADALIVPVERPPTTMELKRALLSYDTVYLPSPEDRDIIPPHLFGSASSGGFFPVHINRGPVRPLGKVGGYDEAFGRLLEEAKAATDQESLKILDSPPDPEAGMFIGGHPPLPDWMANPTWTYGVYRAMAAQPAFVEGISRGLDFTSLIAEDDLDAVAPGGQDENPPQLYADGEKLPPPPPMTAYPGFAVNEAERVALSRLCMGRLGSVVKGLGTCHVVALQPFTSDPGVARVMQLLNQNVASTLAVVDEGDEHLRLRTLLAALEDLVMVEYVDPEVLESMSIPDVLALRTKSWGRAGEAREALANEMVRVAKEDPDPEVFRAACRGLIDEYLEARSDWMHEASNLRIKFLCELGVVASGLGPGSELLQKLVGLGTFEALLVLGGALFARAKDHIPEIRDLLREQEKLEGLPGFSLVRTFAPLIAS